jgi:hypothetical protein
MQTIFLCSSCQVFCSVFDRYIVVTALCVESWSAHVTPNVDQFTDLPRCRYTDGHFSIDDLRLSPSLMQSPPLESEKFLRFLFGLLYCQHHPRAA